MVLVNTRSTQRLKIAFKSLIQTKFLNFLIENHPSLVFNFWPFTKHNMLWYALHAFQACIVEYEGVFLHDLGRASDI